MTITMNGRPCHALVDTGCEETVVYVGCTPQWDRCEVDMVAVNGSAVRCCGRANVHVEAQGRQAAVRAVVVSERLMGVDVLLGMTGIEALGGVFVGEGEVRFGGGGCGNTGPPGGVQAAAAQVRYPEERRIETADFVATFSGGQWAVRWKWADGKGPLYLKNTVPHYDVPETAQKQFDDELRLWVKEGWLQPYDEEQHGPARGLIPLLAVEQEAKNKVRPVLDYRELNEHLVPHTADAEVCREQLRKWRRHGDDVAVIDLKKAFLQLHVVPELWPFQTVIVDGRRYCLTRLGFGLCVAPEIMRAVIREVLNQDSRMATAVLSYADDLLVNEAVVSSTEVAQHFARYGLTCKPPERAADGARLLGLRVRQDSEGVLRWARDDVTPAQPPEVLTRRSVFAWAGQLTSHMPVAGWLRPATAWLKRMANRASADWDTPIDDENLHKQVHEVARRVGEADPSRGQWSVRGDAVVVWTDASAIARGAVLSDPITAEVIEDAAWLRTDTDSDMHINLSELDAAVNGVNMALAWGFKKLDLRTDSATVHRWLTDALSGRARLRTKAQSEMLIRRRVAVFRQLVAEYGLTVTVKLVPSAVNRADELTRVPGEWLRAAGTDDAAAKMSARPAASTNNVASVAAAVRKTARAENIMAVHENVGHQGVRRTLWYARRELGRAAVTKSAVRAVVRSCQVCASIDPAPTRWRHGSLEVERTWERLAMDVTHFRGKHYLTLVDCGPSRYAIWREIRHSDASQITRELETIFLERGAPAEILTDNATEFRGRVMMAFAARWDIKMKFRAAHEPGGNGIIERHHRTIKVMATRQACSVPEAVHRYNATPKDGHNVASAPMHGMFRQTGRDLKVHSEGSGTSEPPQTAERRQGVFYVGDAVWTRKRGDRCTAVSKQGMVTKIVSAQTVEVNGVPWHVRNIRHRLTSDTETATGGGSDQEERERSWTGEDSEDIACPVPAVPVPRQLALEAPPPAASTPTSEENSFAATNAGGELGEAIKTECVNDGDTDNDGEPPPIPSAGDCDAGGEMSVQAVGQCEIQVEEPRRGTRLRQATQLYGDPIPSENIEDIV